LSSLLTRSTSSILYCCQLTTDTPAAVVRTCPEVSTLCLSIQSRLFIASLRPRSTVHGRLSTVRFFRSDTIQYGLGMDELTDIDIKTIIVGLSTTYKRQFHTHCPGRAGAVIFTWTNWVLVAGTRAQNHRVHVGLACIRCLLLYMMQCLEARSPCSCLRTCSRANQGLTRKDRGGCCGMSRSLNSPVRVVGHASCNHSICPHNDHESIHLIVGHYAVPYGLVINSASRVSCMFSLLS